MSLRSLCFLYANTAASTRRRKTTTAVEVPASTAVRFVVDAFGGEAAREVGSCEAK